MYGQVLRHKRKADDLMPKEFQRYPKNVRTDFRRCDSSTLLRYLEHYRAEVPVNPSEADLAAACARHFSSDLSINEEDTVLKFVSYINSFDTSNETKKDDKKRSRARNSRYLTETVENTPVYCICKKGSYGEMIACDNEKCEIEWFHVGCVGVEPGAANERWFCPDCSEANDFDKKDKKTSRSARRNNPDVSDALEGSEDGSSNQDGREGSGKSSHTYSGMITAALKLLPNTRGNFKDICEQIEKKFKNSLNWKAESDLRKTPVWKSSVRKILISNNKFKKVDYSNNIYTLR